MSGLAVRFEECRLLTVLVKSQEDQGTLHEVFVGEEGLEEATRPGAGDGDGGVMAVRGHVGSDEAPLGKSLCLEIVEELGRVLLVRETTRAGVGVVDDCGMLGGALDV